VHEPEQAFFSSQIVHDWTYHLKTRPGWMYPARGQLVPGCSARLAEHQVRAEVWELQMIPKKSLNQRYLLRIVPSRVRHARAILRIRLSRTIRHRARRSPTHRHPSNLEDAMHKQPLQGKIIAALVANAVPELEISVTQQRIVEAGGGFEIFAPRIDARAGAIRSEADQQQPGRDYPLQGAPSQANAQSLQGLLLLGGTEAVDTICGDEESIQLIREFFKLAKPVAALGEGIRALIVAGVVHERRITGPPHLKLQAQQADALWQDATCVCDEGLVTGVSGQNLDRFCDKAIEEYSEGTHVGQTI
jgi:protease I